MSEEETGEGGGKLILRSPVVGVADGAPELGRFVNPLDRLLTIKVLNIRYTLRVPRSVKGRIVEAFLPQSYTPVEYGQKLVAVDPRALALGEASGEEEGAASGAQAGGLDEETIVVKAPSEGIFYRKPSPDAKPFVEEGSEVKIGSVLGLVEVMKCFNQIAYEGAGLPERAVVQRILVEDAAEVKFGQPLFWLRPA